MTTAEIQNGVVSEKVINKIIGLFSEHSHLHAW